MLKNLEALGERFEADILEQLPLKLPSLFGEDGKAIFRKKVIDGLKAKGKYKQKYIDRVKFEYTVIEHLGFIDYFLIVQDYVQWARRAGIKIGPGRGSVCNSLTAFALDITNIDSLYFDLDFDRFMRMDKKKVPDVDLDFETDRRHEVIAYIVSRYPGYSAQVVSYGLYKADNLLNDLFKVCDVDAVSDKAAIKKFVKDNIDEENFVYEEVKLKKECRMWNKQYQNIIEHFSKSYKKIRYFGTHAAGVAITGNNLLDYTALEMRGGKIVTAYDLGNLELIKVVKFDILGLRTMSSLKELEELTEEYFDYSWCEDEGILKEFGKGNTNGIFQFETSGAQGILREIQTDCVEDVLAASALNRPGPLSLRMPEAYAHNKVNVEDVAKSPWYRYSKETYGTIVYQEQIVRICREVGRYEWSAVDRILKVLKGRGRAIKFRDREIEELRVIFYAGAKAGGYSKAEADKIFSTLLIYSFNKGHAAGYAVISIQQMYYKVYHPELFWYITLKYAAKDEDLYKFKIMAVKDGNVLLLPHVNYRAEFSMQKVDGESTLAEGTINIKKVGEKAAKAIEDERRLNGRYTSIENFIDRIPKRQVNAGVVAALKECGALEFDKKVYFGRVKKYNSTLYMKGLN
jgi:DNA polymerase-3 subunit alpha